MSDDGGRTWPHPRRKILVHDARASTDYPSELYRDGEGWITLRVSSGPSILQGQTGTTLMQVPLVWFF